MLGTTFLALSDATSIQGGEILLWGGTGLSWTAGTDVSVRLISATAPTVTDVDVTSAPASADTYGTSEKIEFTVTFDQAVTVTGTPEFEFCLGTTATVSCDVGSSPPARRRAALSSGSGTTALVFRYTVMVGEVDDNGIWIGDQTRTIKLGTGVAIEGTVGGLTAVLTHAEGGAQADHKVNGAAADTTPPEVERVTVPISGSEVELIFDEDLDETVVGTLLASVFSLTVAGQAVTIRDYDILETSLALYMQAGTIKQGQTVVVSYTDPTVGDDTVALQDSAGNDVASFTTGMSGVPAVTNNSTSINTAPGAPTGLAATANGQFQIDLAWTAPASTGGSAITGYKIEVSPDGSNWSDLVANTNSTTTTYAHTGLQAATTRHYRVSAINAVGTSDPSGTDDATTEANTITAQTEMVPADWALKPADIAAGGQFRLMFVSSTTRDATSTDIAAYNTFVSTRAAAGVTAMRTYAADFKALVSTETVNARANTLTRATDTDVPIYWVRTGTVPAGSRVADDYADLYDGTWKTGAGGYDESGGTVGIDGDRFWTGMNTDGTTHATLFMGASGNVYTWRVTSNAVLSASLDNSGTYRIVALSPVFQVAGGTTNTAAMGAPTITGTAQVGQTLTAATTGITDADGLTSPTYTYQWIRVDGTDEEDISGENSSTYTLVDADLGKTIKVKVTFTDDASNTETLTSAATVTVAADTTPPEVESVTVNSTGSTVTLVFDEHLDAAAAGGLHLSAISLTAGGQAVTAPFADFNLQRQTLALTYRYGTIKQGQTVVFSYTDPTAGDDTDTLQDVAGNDVASFTTGMSGVPAVTNNSTNNAATGEPAISGTAQAGQELTADASPIVDTDGLTGVSYSYQWVRVDADGTSNEEDITDATDATYTLTADDAGKKVKVKVSFTDELSGEEERTSAAYPSSGTVTTAANTTAPALLSVTVTSTPRKTTDTYGAREHIEFSMTFDAPVTVTGDPTFAFDLGGASTATWYAGSGTTTLRFSHAVSGGSSGDQDTNGISWAQTAIALNGGTIAGTDNAVAAVLTHAAQSNLAGHKVDGRTTAVTWW